MNANAGVLDDGIASANTGFSSNVSISFRDPAHTLLRLQPDILTNILHGRQPHKPLKVAEYPNLSSIRFRYRLVRLDQHFAQDLARAQLCEGRGGLIEGEDRVY